MKKLGIGSRLLAALLALTMVVSMLPLSVFADDGDISPGDTGLASSIDTLDTISWPIKVYDYLNDGLLFEYASATHHSDATSPNAAYGGGKVMPVFTVGNDYTVNGAGSSSASTGAYAEKAFTHWMKNVSAYKVSVAEQGKGTPSVFKFLRLEPDGEYGTSMPAMVLSDFNSDNSSTYDNEQVRYAVLVYKTNVAEVELTLGMAASNLNGTYYVRYGSYKSNITNPGGYATGPDGKYVNFELVESAVVNAPTDSENPWNYVVIDMNKGPNANIWNQIGDATQIVLDTSLSDEGQYLDLSHVAYFADREEALRFGERAAAFSNDPGEYLPDQYYSVTPGATGNPRPSGASFAVDFTTDAAYSSATASAWANMALFNGNSYAYATQGTGDKIQYARFGCDYDSAPDSGTFVEFGSAKNIDSIRYMAVVYRSSSQSANCTNDNCTKGINFWFESSELYNKVGYSSIGKNASAAYWYDFDHKTGWNVAIFDLREHKDMIYETNTNGVTTIDRVNIICPGFDESHGGDEYMDISHIAFFPTEAAATTYGNAALTYNADPGTGGTTYTGYKHWNMGNNTAFTMLYASGGGGWRDPNGDGVQDDSNAGGENPWSNGYFSYQLGESITWPDGTTNQYRKDAEALGYPVPDDIFFFSAYDGEGTYYDRSYDLSTYEFGYTLFNTITDGPMTAGILKNDLVELKGADGKTYRVPEYKQSAVEYIALLLKNTLAIGQTDQCGNYNYNFVQGSPSAQFGGTDLATALRKALGLTEINAATGNYKADSVPMGEYGTTVAKASQLVGAYASVEGNINSFMDAAYYLLHNLFVDDSYNQLQDDYHYLMLSKAEVTGTGKEAFVFDAGFTTGDNTADSKSAVVFNDKAGTISLSASAGKDQVTYNGDQLTTRYPFMPVQDAEGDYAQVGYYATNGTPYFVEDGADSVTDYGATYAKRNYNYVMQANAAFIFQNQDDLFFQFEGDDDVYLFVNNELVLDIGAAHSITKVKMNMNDYVLRAQKELYQFKLNNGYRPSMTDETFLNMLTEAGVTDETQRADYLRWHHLNLVDGQSYPIDFYYMERHGWGANMRVATNIVMTDPAMETVKRAYQDGGEISYGGLVDGDKSIEYSFSLTNEGQTKLYNLKFNDYDIGISLTPEEGLVVTNDGITDARGRQLDPADLIVQLDGYLDEEKTMPVSRSIRFNGQNPDQELKQFLRDLRASGTETGESDDLFAGNGLWRHATVTIRGIYYKLTEEEVAKKVFNNAVFTTANPAVDSETIINSVDTHQVRIDKDAKYIYQWADHNVYVNPADLVKWVGNGDGTITIGGTRYTAASLCVDTCRNDGVSYDYPDIVVKLDRDGLIVNYLEPGSQLVFIKLYAKSNASHSVVIPLAIYTTDVKDDVIVLDYGLKAELTGKNGITANDYIVVPNRNAQYTIAGVSEVVPAYLSNTANYAYNDYNRISFLHSNRAVTSTDETTKVTTTTLGFSDGDYSYYKEELGADTKLFFTPKDFMDEEYTIYVAVTVHEGNAPSVVGPANNRTNGQYSIDITKEVQMYQRITVLPANVMYYENDFAGITYVDWNGQKVDPNQMGNGSGSWIQGVDQSVNYGADHVYQTGKEIDPATRQPVGNDVISANSMAAVKITKYDKVAQFTFKGTGFELVGRTNAFDSASINLTVRDGKQTGHMALTQNDLYDIATGTWSTVNSGTNSKRTRTIYVDVDDSWSTPYAYYYSETDKTMVSMPGATMVHVEGNRFRVEVPKEATHIKFTNVLRSLPVITEFTNDANAVCNHAAHNMEGHCTKCGSYVGHLYYQDICSVCGVERVDYYLVGYINGADYGFRSDDSKPGFVNVDDCELGEYKFVNGKLTVTFKSDGYVFVKTSPVQTPEGLKSSVFMTDGYPGTGTRTAFLHNVKNGLGYADKLHVPGGVELTFTLAEYWEGRDRLSLNLSYTTANDDVAAGKKVIYFRNTDGWETPTAYYWAGSNPTMVVWPGDGMTHVKDDVYKIELRADAEYVIFNNGVVEGSEVRQTPDLTVPASNMIYSFSGFNQGWANYAEGMTAVKFRNTEGWQNVYAYYWDVDNEMVQWPGEEMTPSGEDKTFEIMIPENAKLIIFNNGTEAPEPKQTNTLDVVPGDTYVFGRGWLSQSTSSVRDIYFRNTEDWSKVNIYYWSEADKSMVAWPGAGMECVEEDIFRGTIPNTAEWVIFTDGTNQTPDIYLDPEMDQSLNMFVYDKAMGESALAPQWYVYGEQPDDSGTTEAFTTLYVQPNSNWKADNARFAAYFFGNGETWVDCTLVAGSDGVYEVEIPQGYPSVIFCRMNPGATENNWNNKWNQSNDLTIPTDGTNCYIVAPDSWDYGNGQWTTYTPVGGVAETGITPKSGVSGVKEYCLVGYINGADYGCNGDYLNVGEYIFVDGTLSTSFAADSYIFVKTTDNANWYMTEAYCSQTTGTFVSGGTEKMLVPGNVELTFTLVENEDGSLTLSYATSDDADTTTKAIYFTNDRRWSKVYVHYWNNSGSADSEYPGVEMTRLEDGTYTCEIPGNAQFVIFNNGTVEEKTKDLTLPTNGANTYTDPIPECGTWEYHEPKRVLYFDAAGSGWNEIISAYYWNSDTNVNNGWPGTEMENVGGTVYSIRVPMDANFIIFNDGSSQTGNLLIQEGLNLYSYQNGRWSNYTRTVYYEANTTGSVKLSYWAEGGSPTSKIMSLVEGRVYRCELPMNAKYVKFMEGDTIEYETCLSDDHNLYSAAGWSVYDPASQYFTEIYFNNTLGWQNVHIYYWSDANGQMMSFPGNGMTFVSGTIYKATIPAAATKVVFSQVKDGQPGPQTADLIIAEDKPMFTVSGTTDDQGKHTGQWTAYTKPKTDAIHQVPVLRVDNLPLGQYIVDICGMPTYDTTAEKWWEDLENNVLDTYLYLDGIRIYQPMGKTNINYALSENNAEFSELRDLILLGYAAVAQYTKGKEYNSTDTYVGNVSWTENRNGTGGDMKTEYVGNQLSSNKDYLLIGPNNETYLNGNAQTQAVILYVTETEAQGHALQIAARGIDAGLFLGKESTGVNATLYYGIWAQQPDGSYEYAWRPLDTVLSGVEQYYTIAYKDCPWQMINGVKTYQVALYIRSGMIAFTNVKTVGLSLTSAPLATQIDEQLNYGVVVKPGTEAGDGNFGGDSGAETPKADQLYYSLEGISFQMNAIEKVEDAKALPITLKYPALSFEDEVYYNIFYQLDGLEEAPVEMGLLLFDSLEEDGNIENATSIVSGSTAVNGMYMARTNGIAAKDLGKTIYFKVFAQLADGRYVYSKVASYSTLDYAKSILSGDNSPEMKAMVAAMLNYGAAAQGYFGGISAIRSLLTDGVKGMLTDYSGDLLEDVVPVDARKAGDFKATAQGFGKKYPAITFDGAFAINYYFAPSAPVQGDMTLYYWNAEDYAGADQLTADNATGSIVMTPGAEYSAVVDAIAAKDIDETVYVAAVYSSNGNDYCSGVLAYSLGAYCESMAESNDAISPFAAATAIYGHCAKKLFG